ncbi:phasin family protein [Aquabacterium sp.]|uniref:phasin family protein n=1 Tax=Aquabacterium sp. TaxID=1872578 RepID=UPI002C7A4FCC|nr:phasin family protein [Aquabacterium sp.]HSW05167.1 phasin family protein [Aquabacterium sp.]
MATTTTKKPDAAAASTTNELPSLDDLVKLLERFRLPGVDADALIAWQRKDLDALAEANRQAYAGIKALAERRDEILRETLVQWQEALKNAIGTDALAKQADSAKLGLQQAIDHVRELAEMETQSRNNAWQVVRDRTQENMANLQKLLLVK